MDIRNRTQTESSMMTSSNGNTFRVTGHLCEEFTPPGEFPAQRLVTRSFDVFFDLHPNKRLSKQSRPLWRHCNANHMHNSYDVQYYKMVYFFVEW